MKEEPKEQNENNNNDTPQKKIDRNRNINHKENKEPHIKSISINLKAIMQESLMFYSLKSELLARILFVSTLVILFLGEVLQISDKSLSLVVYSSFVISNIFFSIYLCAYLKDLRKQEYTIKSILFSIFKKFFRVLSISIINSYIFIAFSNIYLFIPGIILGVTMIFNLCYVIDKNYSLSRSIEESNEDTIDQKFHLFLIIIKILLPLFAIALLILMLAIKVVPFAFSVVFYFVYSIIMLIMHRVIALIYHSIIYSHSRKSL